MSLNILAGKVITMAGILEQTSVNIYAKLCQKEHIFVNGTVYSILLMVVIWTRATPYLNRIHEFEYPCWYGNHHSQYTGTDFSKHLCQIMSKGAYLNRQLTEEWYWTHQRN